MENSSASLPQLRKISIKAIMKNALGFASILKIEVALMSLGVSFGAWTAALNALPKALMTEFNVLVWIRTPLRLFFPFERLLGACAEWVDGRFLVAIGYSREGGGWLDDSSGRI